MTIRNITPNYYGALSFACNIAPVREYIYLSSTLRVLCKTEVILSACPACGAYTG